MSVVQSVTEYFCPQCEVWSVAAAWEETERECEDCGSHSALRCPACEESTDTVTMDLEEREKMTHAANDWDLCGACGGRRDAHIEGIGNTFWNPRAPCPEFRPPDEQGEWRWIPLVSPILLPLPGVRVLVFARGKYSTAAAWHIGMRGESLLEPDKGIFWFTDAGRELLDIVWWREMPPDPLAVAEERNDG
mgnify:CR=1 FL=1